MKHGVFTDQGRSKVVKLGGARHNRAKQGGEINGKF